MFDIGFSELVLVGIVALLVLGPEKLPHAIRMIAAYSGRIKRALSELKYELENEVEVQELKNRLKNEIANPEQPHLNKNERSEAETLQKQTLLTAHPNAPSLGSGAAQGTESQP